MTRMKLWVFVVTVGVAIASASAVAAASSPIPRPLPVGPDGLPLDVQAQVDALGPGESKLLAVKAGKDEPWYAPADVDVTVSSSSKVVDGTTLVGSQVVSGTLRPKGSRSPDTVTPDAPQVTNAFGCDILVVAPYFTSGYNIQGDEDFFSCANVAATSAQVCLKESKYYGLNACKTSNHAGSGNWTAWSRLYACQAWTRSWKTLGTNLYTSTSGQQSLWAFDSGWASGYFC